MDAGSRRTTTKALRRPAFARAFFLAAGIAALAFPSSCAEERPDPARPRFERRESAAAGLRYLLYLPAGYDLDAARAWPMIVYLHGAGSSGDDPGAIKSGGLPARLAAGRGIPFVVLSPLCPRGRTFSSEGMPSKLALLVGGAESELRVDRERVSLTGFSMGGNGAWDLAVAMPSLFSRLAPVGSEGLSDPAEAARLRGLPVWIFQGREDGTFAEALAVKSYRTLKAAGVAVRYTPWEGAGHLESAALTYDDEEHYLWLAKGRGEE